jgi:hypothetical protein
MAEDRALKEHYRSLIASFYDCQQLRIQMGNRMCRNFAAQLGQEAGMREDELSPEAKALLETLRAEYALLADAVARTSLSGWTKALASHAGLIATPFDVALTRTYFRQEEDEHELERAIAALVVTHPIWDAFLAGVRGCGPIMAAVLIAELSPYRSQTVSQFWGAAGLDVVLTEEVDPETGETHIVGTGRSRRSEHLVDRTYIDRDGKEQVRKSITYVPRLKTKMLGVLGPSFLRAGGHYADVYRGYKHRWEQHPKWGLAAQERGEPGATAMHRHRAALRYCVKMFLQDLFIAWRKLEGLPISDPYAVAKLGMPRHHGEEHAGMEHTG